jgi:tetratricopeptide (TPR) repeat protein
MDKRDRPNQPHREDIELHAETERALKILDCGGPSLPAIYLSVIGERPLKSEQQSHVASCPVCQRALELARWEVGGTFAKELPFRPEARPSRRCVLDSVKQHVDAVRLGEDGESGDEPLGPEVAIPQAPRTAAADWFRSAVTPVVRHWRAGLGGLAVAAGLVIAVVSLFQHAPTARADDALLRTIALRLVLLPDLDPFLSDNPAALQALIDEVGSSRRQRDEAVRLVAEALDDESRSKATESALQSWAHVYRRLRDLGRFEEALAEIHQCIHYCRTTPAFGGESGWYHVVTADLGHLYLSMADLPNARRAYQQSIDAREKTRQAFLSRKDNPVSVPGRASNEAFELGPLYWSMSRVAIAEGNFEDAHKWLQRSDHAFRTYFAAVCEANGMTCPADGGALTAFRATPDVFQAPPERMSGEEHDRFAAQYKGFVPSTGLTTKLHAHLYFTACLALAEGNVSTAEQTLRVAKGVPLSYCADEDRLDFFEPMLAARIAIADRRYKQALDFIAEAEQHAGLPPCSDIANNRPIAPARIAELTLLKGVALLGVDETSADGRQLVEKALAIPEKLAAGLPAEQGEAFLKQFEPWQRLAEANRRPEQTTKPTEEARP